MPAVKTFGTAKLDTGTWWIDCEPHVALRLKRVFGKVEQKRGIIGLSATPENCRDLEWFAERYPLRFSDPEVLAQRARAFDAQAERIVRIMDGSFQLPEVTMELPPRHYQHQAAAIVLTSGSLLLADELGLGKTVAAITVLAERKTLPALVVVPAHLPRQWKAEIERFLPFYYVHIAKKGTPYPVDHRGRNPDVLILTYHKLNGWVDHLAGEFPTVIFDEVQELRVGRGSLGKTSLKYHAAEYVALRAQYRMGLSATPIYNYGDEFYSVLNVLKPGSLGTRSEFLREWCVQVSSDKARIENPKAFGTYLREAGFMLRRTRQQVARELPSLQRVVHELDTSVQISDSSAAAELAEIILSQQGKGFDKLQAAQEFDMRLRQATGIAKAPFVAEFVKILVEQGSVVLFGWHRTVYEIWKEHFAKLEPAWYTGSESPAKKASEIERFVSGKTRLLIMSLRAGLGVDGLQKVCSRVVVGELDWSPGVLEQCVGRIHRDGQADPVLAYYLTARDGSDPVMTDVLGLKKAQLDGVKEPFGELVIPKEVDPNHVKKLAEDYLRRQARGKP